MSKVLIFSNDGPRLEFDITSSLSLPATRTIFHFIGQVRCLLDGFNSEFLSFVVFEFMMVFLGDVDCLGRG